MEGMGLVMLWGCFGMAFAGLLLGMFFQRFNRRHLSALGGEIAVAPPPVSRRDLVRTWWVRPVDLAGLALFSLIFLAFGISACVADERGVEPAIDAAALVINAVMFAGLVGIVVALVRGRVSPALWLGLRWQQWVHLFWFGPLVVLGMWVVMGVLQASGYLALMEEWAGGSSMQDSVELMRESKDVVVVALMAFSAAIIAPLAEEVIFRGYLYPVAKAWSGKWFGVFFSALWFSACHGNVPLILPLFLLGVILALAYEWTGSLWAAIGIHFFFNSATVLIQLAIRAGLIPDMPS